MKHFNALNALRKEKLDRVLNLGNDSSPAGMNSHGSSAPVSGNSTPVSSSTTTNDLLSRHLSETSVKNESISKSKNSAPKNR
jgi:hypothetical protein